MALWQPESGDKAHVDWQYVPPTKTPLAGRMQDWALENSRVVQTLSPLECIKTYSQNYMSSSGILILRLQNTSDENPVIFDTYMHTHEAKSWSYETDEGYSWMCNQLDFSDNSTVHLTRSCTPNLDLLHSAVTQSGWRPILGRNEPVESCIREVIDEHCRLEFSLYIAILVLVVNFAKAALMFTVVFYSTGRPLLTVGEAVASFLSYPDKTTQGLRLWDKASFRHWRSANALQPEPPAWQKQDRRVFTAAGYGSISTCIVM
jgi:hypothetical protein